MPQVRPLERVKAGSIIRGEEAETRECKFRGGEQSAWMPVPAVLRTGTAGSNKGSEQVWSAQ